MSRSWLAAATLSLSSLLACGEAREPAAPEAIRELRPVGPAPIVAPRRIASEAAFDLVATSEGAVLAWGEAIDDGGAVHAIALDPYGALRGEVVVVGAAPAELGPAAVDEVAMVAAGNRIAIAWTLRAGGQAQAMAAISSAELSGFSPVRELGALAARPLLANQRGSLTLLALPSGEAVVSHRITDGPCRASTGTCARFARSRLDGASMRGDDPMEVSAPCEPLLVGALSRGGSWFQGICHVEEGLPRIALYAIHPEISHASAPDVAVGCEARGIAPGMRGAIAVGTCGATLGAEEVDEDGRIVAQVREATSSVGCAEGRPVIELRGADPVPIPGASPTGPGASLEVRLTVATSRLEAILPDAVAPRGSRAAWTGESLLVAVPHGRDLALQRYQCELARLVRSDLR